LIILLVDPGEMTKTVMVASQRISARLGPLSLTTEL